MSSELASIYGAEKAQAIISYLRDFESNGGDAFPARSTKLVTIGGTSLFLVTCPIDVTGLQDLTVAVATQMQSSAPSPSGSAGTVPSAPTVHPFSVGMLFTPGFPATPPVCNLKVGAGFTEVLALPTQHPAIAASGNVKLDLLPALLTEERGSVPSMFSILFAISELLEQTYSTPPVAALPSSATPRPGATPPAASLSSSASAGANAGGALLRPGLSISPIARLVYLNEVRTAEDAALLALFRLGDEYLAQRESAAGKTEALNETCETLTKMIAALNEQKSTLIDARAQIEKQYSTLAALCQSCKGLPVDAADSLVTTDDKSEQLTQLVADVYACDDTLDLLEQRLQNVRSTPGGAGNAPSSSSAASLATAPNGLYCCTCDDYLREVNKLARRQFMARFLAKKVYSTMTAERSLERLVHKFPELDASVVATVLRECLNDFMLADARLAEMTGRGGGGAAAPGTTAGKSAAASSSATSVA